VKSAKLEQLLGLPDIGRSPRMEMLFSTQSVHPRDRFDYWHDVARANIVDHDSWSECGLRFEAQIETGRLGGLGLVRFTNSAMTISHTLRHASQVTSDDLFLCRQIGGVLVLEQEARDVRLEAGDMTLLDPILPYAGSFSSESNLLVVKLPRRALAARVGRSREMLARVMKPVDAEASLASSFLSMLPAHSGKMSQMAEEITADQTLDLIALSLAGMMHSHRPQVSSARAVVSSTVRAVVESRLHDSNLDGTMVAAAAGVSLRYVNAVLAQENSSVARLIQERRLARCRRALNDPLQAHRSVSEIAYAWGFSDMTHFGRCFRKAYGMLPREYRRRAIRP
jgi:AraC-like DNA-binding protein